MAEESGVATVGIVQSVGSILAACIAIAMADAGSSHATIGHVTMFGHCAATLEVCQPVDAESSKLQAGLGDVNIWGHAGDMGGAGARGLKPEAVGGGDQVGCTAPPCGVAIAWAVVQGVGLHCGVKGCNEWPGRDQDAAWLCIVRKQLHVYVQASV